MPEDHVAKIVEQFETFENFGNSGGRRVYDSLKSVSESEYGNNVNLFDYEPIQFYNALNEKQYSKGNALRALFDPQKFEEEDIIKMIFCF